MTRTSRFGLISVLTACVAFAACQREPASTAAPASATATPARTAVDTTLANRNVAAPAWLHERLPDDTIAYVRIPSPWSLVAAPDGRALDPLLADAAHVKIVDSIKQGFATDPTIARTGWQALIKLLLQDLASPLEIAVTAGTSKVASPASSVLISLRTRYANVGELNDAVAKLGNAQTVQLHTPFDATSGNGQLAFAGKPVFGHFDPGDQRVTLLAGMTASATGLDAQIKNLSQPHAHAMQTTEAQIDQSGQGLFVWLSVEAFRSAAAMGLQQPDQKFAATLVKQTRSIALGWGTVNGKGRVSLLLDAPGANLLRYLPRSAKQTTLQTAGEPHWAIAMSLPTTTELAQFQAALADDFGPQTAQAFADALAKLKTELGVDLNDVLSVLGPEIVGVGDAAGRYTAVRLRDAAKFEALVRQLADKYKFEYSTRQIGGATFHHVDLPGFPQMDNALKVDNVWFDLYRRIGYHFYWIEQDGNLLVANIPQTLVDYHDAKTHTALRPWLTQRQGLDAGQALFAATARTHDAQREVYAAYLQGLQALADVAGAHIDLFTLPSADGLALPRDGALGVQIHASDDDLGADFVFEQSPLEVFSSANGGMTTVAVVAIFAAIALPAYQDYTVRSHISEGVVLADGVKSAIAEYYQAHKHLPRDLGELGLSPPEGLYTQSVRVEGGVVVIAYKASAGTGLAGRTLRITPYASASGALAWQCGNSVLAAGAHPLAAPNSDTSESIQAKYLPTSCRP
jgi:Tfp pilus assembly major pilin PilA